MFGFIKKLLGGIAAFFGGIFRSKKSEENEAGAALPRKKSGGYYMEIDESKDTKPDAEKNQKKPESVKALASEGVQKIQSATAELSELPKAALATIAAPSSDDKSDDKKDSSKPQESSKSVAAASKKTSRKASKPQETSESKEAQRPPVELIQTAEGVEAVPAEKPATPINGKVQSQPDTTFAPKYLNPISSSNSRRRPGPSMSNFMDMARQVKK